MKKKNTIPVIIFLIVSLVAGLFLVKQSQETRRGAAFANTSLMVLPSEKIVKNVGEVLNAKVYFQTESGAKVDGVQTVLCYGDHLVLDEISGVVANTSNGFDAEPIVVIKDAGNGKWCATMVATSKKDVSKLKTTGEVFSVNFTAVKAGSGELTLDKEKSMVTGDNPASPTDKIITVTAVENTTYEITGVQTDDCEVDADCPAGFECYQPPTPTCPADDKSCTMALARRYCRAITTDPVLNYKVTFRGVRADATSCAVNWPLKITVLGNGETKVFSEVIPQLISSSGDWAVYKGSLTLTGFTHTNRVAVFIKGPKHLQMKYGIQNQKTSYDKAGGEITLTSSAKTSPEYDFTGYEMLPGDLVGKTVDDKPNGIIDGIDFSYLKNRPNHESVAEGGNLLGDLDGNCQINTNDINLLKISLETKQGELY